MRRKPIQTAAAAVALALAAAPAQGADSGSEVLALDRARARALETGDVAFLDRITDEDYVHVESSGLIRDKAQLLDGIRRGEIRFASFVIDDNRARRFGDTIVVTGSYHNVFLTAAGPAPVKHARHIRVYVRRADGWRNVSHQATTIAR